MTVHPGRPASPALVIDKTFVTIRAALFHPQDLAAFDDEYAELTGGTLVPMTALGEFLTRWWNTALVANRDRDDWARLLEVGTRLERGERPAGLNLADVAAARGHRAQA